MFWYYFKRGHVDTMFTQQSYVRKWFGATSYKFKPATHLGYWRQAIDFERLATGDSSRGDCSLPTRATLLWNFVIVIFHRTMFLEIDSRTSWRQAQAALRFAGLGRLLATSRWRSDVLIFWIFCRRDPQSCLKPAACSLHTWTTRPIYSPLASLQSPVV